MQWRGRCTVSGVASKPSRDFGAVGERQTRPKSETATAKSAATAAGGAARILVFVYVCTVKVGVFTKEVAFLSITQIQHSPL